jgi:predicted ATPase
LKAIAAALAVSNDTGERWAVPEVLRIKARALQAAGKPTPGEIETVLLSALKIAREQKAICWQLRVACDLARVWHEQGQGRKALELLESIYDQFTEGLDTADLHHARTLMQTLRRSAKGKRSKSVKNSKRRLR